MQSRDRSLLGEILPPEERAIEAVVARYQRVAPAVTRFARSLCGNDELRVRLGAEASSGKDEVVVNPGLFQAAYTRRAPVTPDEVALASALHEVVHLVSTDFEDRRPVPKTWLAKDQEAPTDDVDLLDALNRAGGKAGEALFFALEDARQERQGLNQYPGARSVLTDLYRAATRDAMKTSTPLGQFAVGCFMLLGGHAERGLLEKRSDRRVALALADAQPFLEKATGTGDPWEIGTLALQLLNLAKLHGIVSIEDEGQTVGEQKQHDEDAGDSIAEGVDRVRLMTPILTDARSYEDTKQAAEARSGESDRKGPADEAGQESTDQILRVSEAPTVYLPSGHGGKLLVVPFPERFRQFMPEGRALLAETSATWGVRQQHISGELYPLFAANQRRGLQSGFDAGDLSPHAPLLLAAGLYERMYERRSLRSRRSYAVSLLIDGSASMLQPQPIGDSARRSPWGLAAATLGAWSLAHLCDELQVEFEVALFNRSFAATVADSEWSYTRRQSQAMRGLKQSQGTAADRLTNTVNHYMLKSFNQRWRIASGLMEGLFLAAADPRTAADRARRDPREAPPVSLFTKGANVDEFNVAHAADRLNRTGATVRVLVVLSDGMTRGSADALAQAVRAAEASGVTVLGIGIGGDTVESIYGRYRIVQNPASLANSMVNGVRDALRRSLASWGFDGWWIKGARQEIDTSQFLQRKETARG